MEKKLHHQPEFYNSGPVEKKQKCTQGPACHKDNDDRKMAQSLHHSSATEKHQQFGIPSYRSKPVLWLQPEDKLLGTLG